MTYADTCLWKNREPKFQHPQQIHKSRVDKLQNY